MRPSGCGTVKPPSEWTVGVNHSDRPENTIRNYWLSNKPRFGLRQFISWGLHKSHWRAGIKISSKLLGPPNELNGQKETPIRMAGERRPFKCAWTAVG